MPINFMSSIAFSKYNKLLPKPLSSIITSISVKKVEKGNIWVETVFTQLRDVNSEEANEVISLRTEIIEGIKDEKEYYGSAPKPVEGGLEPLKLDAPEDFDPFEPGNKL